MLFTKNKPITAESRLLDHLKRNRKYGSFNYELASPLIAGLGYRGRISELRQEGHNIQCVRIKGGVTKYYLNEE